MSVIAFAADSPSSTQDNISFQLLEIDALLYGGDLEKSLQLAKKLKAQYGDHPLYGWQLDGRLGVALMMQGDFAASIAFLESAIQTRPLDPDYHRNLGSALMGLGHKGRALSEYTQAVELAPDNPIYQLELGQLLVEFKNYPLASIHLVLAAGLCKECLDANKALAHLYLAMEKYSMAIPVFQELLVSDPGDSSRRDLVQTLQAAGQDSLLVDLLARWPANELPLDELHVMVNAERRLGQYSQAMLLLQRRLELPANQTPENIYNRHEFWGEVAYSLLLSDQLDAALRGFDLALALDPGNHAYTNNRQVLLNKISQRESHK